MEHRPRPTFEVRSRLSLLRLGMIFAFLIALLLRECRMRLGVPVSELFTTSGRAR